jgi:hypothetical protein
MALDESREFTVVIDSVRSVSGIPSDDGATVVLTIIDPVSAAVVELTQLELSELISELEKLQTI